MAASYDLNGSAAAVAFPATPSLLFEEDDGFGDFTFAPISTATWQQPQQDDDDWGEFVSSPAGSRPAPSFQSTQPQLSFFDAFPAESSSNSLISGPKAAWEKPRGALPLSIFGDEDKVEEKEGQGTLESPAFPAAGFAFSSSFSLRKDGKGSGLSAGNLTDLIKNLYSQAAPVGALENGNENIAGSRPAEGGDGEDVDENGWDFKSSISPMTKEEGEQILDLSGIKKNAALDYFQVGIFGNRSGDPLETTSQLDIANGVQGLVDAYANHEGMNVTWHVSSGVVPDKNENHKTNHIQNGHVSNHNFKHEVDDESWEFKSASSESKAVTSSWEELNTTEAELEGIRTTTENKAARSTWEDNEDEWTTRSYINEKEVLGRISFQDRNVSPSGIKLQENGINGTTYSLVDDPKKNILNLYMYNSAEQPDAILSAKHPTANGQVSAEFGNSNFHETEMQFSKVSERVAGNQEFMSEIDEVHSLELTKNTSIDLYCRLKEGSTFLINHHLEELKEALKVAALSGEQAKGMEIDKEIQAVYKKLPVGNTSENGNNVKFLSRDVCVSHLLKEVEEPNSKAFEQEFHLSEKIRLADKNLDAAIGLLEHTNSILGSLALASNEDQIAYIVVWSNMAAACARELQHGAMIWVKSLQAEVSAEILHGEGQYFLALGEIYRVAELLRALIKLYKPWILSNWGYSSKLLASLDECSDAWISLGLEKALKRISDSKDEEHSRVAKVLLASIRDICDSSLQIYDNTSCRISLLSAEALENMQLKLVLWNGQHYCVKLANLWVNRISCDPPQLPHIQVR